MSEVAKNLQSVLARMDGKSLKSMRVASEVETRRLETPSLSLTMALSGGWAHGRQGLLWGAKSAGKSTLLLQQIAIAQQKGLVCALFDVEGSWDKVWAEKNGVDTEELIYSESGSVAAVVNDVRAMVNAGVDFIGIDSISMLMPATYLEKDGAGTLKPFEETGAIGGLARSMSPALAQITYTVQSSDNDPVILYISQVRSAQKGAMYWGLQPSGGNAMDHAISQSVLLTVSNGRDALMKGEVQSGNRLYEKAIGRQVDWRVDKDRVGPGLGETGKYMLYFDGPHIGIDRYAEVVELGVATGVIKKAGAWYSYDDGNIGQGETKAAAYLRENPDVYDEVVQRING